MPLFNFRCLECENSFEELVKSLEDRVSCPKCKSEKVEKKLPNKLNSASSPQGSSCG